MSATATPDKTTPTQPAKDTQATGRQPAKPAAAKSAKGPREGSAMHAALTILKNARNPLTPQEILDRAKDKGLATGLKGKTPAATMGAQLATANKRGLYVTRPEPGKYALRK